MQKAVTLTHTDGLVLRGMEHLPEGKNLPAVILFHGFTGTKLEPHRLFLKISRALEVLGIASFRFDFLGCGESDGNFEDMTVIKEVFEGETILSYVKNHPSIDSNRVILLGMGMGGLVASLLAGELTDEIHKLILICPDNMRSINERVETTMEYIEERNAYDHWGNLVGKPFLNELTALEVWSHAARYNGYVLLIHGTKDETVAHDISNQYIEHCYGSKGRLHSVEGADHTFNSYHWEKEVIDSICGFVS